VGVRKKRCEPKSYPGATSFKALLALRGKAFAYPKTVVISAVSCVFCLVIHRRKGIL
jgi:hypothetical protein